MEEILGFPFWLPFRRKFKPDDPFFSPGNLERELLAKQVALDLNEDQRSLIQKVEEELAYMVCCPIVGCGAKLNSLENFEDHYHARHMASCSVCSRVFPTSRLLGIHVSEAHDSFFQTKVARGFPMYECLVEGCHAKLMSYTRRQQHLVDKHKFPASFQFFRKSHPSKHHRQRTQLKKPSCSSMEKTNNTRLIDVAPQVVPNRSSLEETTDGVELAVDSKIDDLVAGVSRISTSDSCPSSISFGHRHSRGLVFNLNPRREKNQMLDDSLQ